MTLALWSVITGVLVMAVLLDRHLDRLQREVDALRRRVTEIDAALRGH